MKHDRTSAGWTSKAQGVPRYRSFAMAAVAIGAGGAAMLAAVWSASGFDSFGKTPVHRDITITAAATNQNWNAAARDLLAAGVAKVDWDESQLTRNGWVPNNAYRAGHHFDRTPGVTDANAFRDGRTYVEEEYLFAVIFASANNAADSRVHVAKGFHALEDFFSHSNFVDLAAADQATVLRAIWDDTVAPPAGLRLTGYNPNPTVADPDPGLPPGDTYAHKTFCKDNPRGNAESQLLIGGQTKHALARAAATTAATDFLQRMRNELTAAEWNGVRVALATDPDPSDAAYAWVAVQPYNNAGFTVSSHGTTVVFAPGAIGEDVRAGVLAPTINFFWDDEQLDASDGARMSLFREIRPLGTAFPSPATAQVQFTPSEVQGLAPATLRVYFADSIADDWTPVSGSIVNYQSGTAFFAAVQGGVYAIGGQPVAQTPIPTIGQWGLIVSGAVLMLGGSAVLIRRAGWRVDPRSFIFR